MAVYNGEKFLEEAIGSILKQTFSNFEFIIIDDGSEDTSLKIIKNFKDKRISILENNKNIGLSASLNKGIKLSKGKYIAINDSDDNSFPLRLIKQVKFLEEKIIFLIILLLELIKQIFVSVFPISPSNNIL